MTEYELSARHDVRPLVLRTALTYLELDGVLRQGTPFYAGYQLRSEDGSLDELVARFDAARAEFLGGVRQRQEGARSGRRSTRRERAAALGEDRAADRRGARATSSSRGSSSCRPPRRASATRVLAAADAAALLDRLAGASTRREQAEMPRIGSRCSRSSTHDGCQVHALVAYFGEERTEPCGHCTHCLSGGRGSSGPEPRPPIETAVGAARARGAARRAPRRARRAAPARALPVRHHEPGHDAREADAGAALRQPVGSAVRRRARLDGPLAARGREAEHDADRIIHVGELRRTERSDRRAEPCSVHGAECGPRARASAFLPRRPRGRNDAGCARVDVGATITVESASRASAWSTTP